MRAGPSRADYWKKRKEEEEKEKKRDLFLCHSEKVVGCN